MKNVDAKRPGLIVAFDAELAQEFAQAEQRKLNVNDFISDFLCQFVSDSTKRAYLKDLNNFFSFVKSGGQSITHPRQIQSYHFQKYRDRMMSNGLASATVNRRLVAIRSFMKWSINAGLIERNPLENVKLPKVQTERETLAFDDDEAVRMISAPDTATHRGRTHRLAMVLLFNLGLRRAELTNIKVGDVYEDRGHTVLSVFGKGGKKRIIPLAPYVVAEIEKYKEALFNGPARVELTKDDYLLQKSNLGRKNDRPMCGSTVYRIIAKYARALGINKRVSPHSCRATVISHLLDVQKASIRDVASFAGHSNISTTESYDKRRGNLNNSAAYAVALKD